MSKCIANVDRLRGYKIEIYPTEEQKEKIRKVIDCYRAVYNIALGIQLENYEKELPYIKYYDMCKIFSDKRNNDPEFAWLKYIQISTIRQALTDINNAFMNFFNKKTKFPKFKSKKKSKKFFTSRSERTSSRKNSIRIPELGLVNAKQCPIPENTRMYNTGVVFDGYRYWFYCQTEQEVMYDDRTEYSDPIGIDVGIRNMITTSNEDFFKYSNTKKLEKRLKRQQRRLQKHYNKYLTISLHTKTKYEDIPKSKNMEKLLYARFKTIEKIKHKISNDINCATKSIVEQYPSDIVIESISSQDQIKNHKWISKYAPHMLYYEIHRQLIYKSEDRGINIIKADKEFPSSQICSNCGDIHKVYGNSIYKCPKCGFKTDRDLNAAYNLRNLAYLK